MKALSWHGKGDIRFETVPDPKIEHPRDAILKVTATAIWGPIFTIYGGLIPAMRSGDVVGHETMGEVVGVGPYRRSVRDSGAYSTVFCAGQANKMIAFDLGVSTNLRDTPRPRDEQVPRNLAHRSGTHLCGRGGQHPWIGTVRLTLRRRRSRRVATSCANVALSYLRAPVTAADPTCFHFQPRPGLTVKLDFATQSRDQCLYGGESLFAERRARRDETAVLSLG